MPKHVTISLLNGTKHSAANLADSATTAAGFITISMGDSISNVLTAPLISALTHCRRSIEERGSVAPVAVPLYSYKSAVSDVANNTAIAATSVGITIGSGIVTRNNTTEFKERVLDAIRAWAEGLA